VIADVILRELSGAQAARQLRGLNPDLRFCFMTGDERKLDDPELAALGPVAVFPKPFQLGEVIQAVRDALGPARPRP
jgi:CheY-like chemotaxis protein